MGPGYGAPFVATETGEEKEATLVDYKNFCKLVQTSKYLDINGFMMVEPSYIPPETAHLDMLFSNITLSDKVFMGSPGSRQAALDTIEMAKIVLGKHREARMISLINSLSPLQFSQDMTAALIEFARVGQPVIIHGGAMMGSTGPITLAGTQSLQNAMILAGICLTQLITPGSPVIYGIGGTPLDMKTGGYIIGSPELVQSVAVGAVLAQHYNIPTRGGGAFTDAHLPDMQAGMESAMVLSAAGISGISLSLHACGILGSYMAMSYEKFIADEELCGMVKKLLKPIGFSNEEIGLDIIKKVGIEGQYLTELQTLKRCRSKFFMPDVLNKMN